VKNVKPKTVTIYNNYKSTTKSSRDCSVLLTIWKYKNMKYQMHGDIKAISQGYYIIMYNNITQEI